MAKKMLEALKNHVVHMQFESTSFHDLVDPFMTFFLGKQGGEVVKEAVLAGDIRIWRAVPSRQCNLI